MRACGALGGGAGARGAVQAGACGACGGASGCCAVDEDEAWGSGVAVLIPHCKTYHTRPNVLTNRSLGISLIPPSIRD